MDDTVGGSNIGSGHEGVVDEDGFIIDGHYDLVPVTFRWQLAHVKGRDLLAIGEVFAVICHRIGQQARSNVIFEKGGQLPNVGRIQKMSKGSFW